MRLTALLALLLAPLLAQAASDLPVASNVIARVLARAQAVAHEVQTNHYAYDKRTVTEELDDKDAVTKSTERLYKVVLIGGLPFPRLVKVQGHELTPAQLEKQNQRELAFRARVTNMDMEKKAKKQEGLATQELIDRFDFKITKRETIQGRPTLVISFAPKPGGPEKSMEDKIFQKVSGVVWVDEAEAEVAKLDAQVKGPVPLGWFGAIGSLKQFHARFDRLRLPDGVWVNNRSEFLVSARQLFTTMHSKTTEESSGFHRE